jgi:hypothetical protein
MTFIAALKATVTYVRYYLFNSVAHKTQLKTKYGIKI